MDTLNSVFINKQFLPGEFLSAEFLTEQCKNILKFYDQRVIDPIGGYFQNYYDDGTLYDHGDKHLVTNCQIIVNYALASMFFTNDKNRQEHYVSIATHGLHHLENSHWQADSETYIWSIVNYQVYDTTQQACGYAFVLLAYAAAKKAGVITSDDKILATYYLLEERFWQAEYQLYADEISPTGELSSYRGQNTNMHICEALVAAYEATDNTLFLMRAFTITQQIVIHQAGKTNHLIWEHYTESFEPD